MIISIVIPVKQLDDCIYDLVNSINCEELLNAIELIFVFDVGYSQNLVDNFSRELAAKSLIFLCIKAQQPGIYPAMNCGLDSASGDWVIFSGIDDFFFKHQLAELCEHLVSSKSDLIFAGVLIDGRLKKSASLDAYDLNLDNIGTSHSVGMVIRRQFHKKIGKYNPVYIVSADYDFYIRALKETTEKELLPNVVLGQWSTGGLSSREGVIEKLICHFRIRRNNGLPLMHCILALIYCLPLYAMYFIKRKLYGICANYSAG